MATLADNNPQNRINHYKQEIEDAKLSAADLALELIALDNRKTIVSSMLSDKHQYISMRSQWVRDEEKALAEVNAVKAKAKKTAKKSVKKLGKKTSKKIVKKSKSKKK